VANRTEHNLIIKEKDEEYLEKLVGVLPKKNFDEVFFIQEVILAAQDVRKLELNQEIRDPRKKVIRPDRQKTYVKDTLRNQAYSLYKILRTLPDDCAMRIDNQHQLSGHIHDGYEILPRSGFTEVAMDIVHQLIDYCDKSYEFNNQGWRNLQKTQESRIALAWEMSGGKLTTSVDSSFFYALCNFRNYCQVPGYDEEKVSSTEINRIINQLS